MTHYANSSHIFDLGCKYLDDNKGFRLENVLGVKDKGQWYLTYVCFASFMFWKRVYMFRQLLIMFFFQWIVFIFWHNDCLCCVDDAVRFEWPIWPWSQRWRSNILQICLMARNAITLTFLNGGCSYFAQWMPMLSSRHKCSDPRMTFDEKVNVKNTLNISVWLITQTLLTSFYVRSFIFCSMIDYGMQRTMYVSDR